MCLLLCMYGQGPTSLTADHRPYFQAFIHTAQQLPKWLWSIALCSLHQHRTASSASLMASAVEQAPCFWWPWESSLMHGTLFKSSAHFFVVYWQSCLLKMRNSVGGFHLEFLLHIETQFYFYFYFGFFERWFLCVALMLVLELTL